MPGVAQVRSHCITETLKEMALGAGFLEHIASALRITARWQLGQPIRDGGFAIAVFLVAPEFGGTGFDSRRTVPEQTPTLLQIKIQLADFDVALFHGAEERFLVAASLQQELNDGSLQRS